MLRLMLFIAIALLVVLPRCIAAENPKLAPKDDKAALEKRVAELERQLAEVRKELQLLRQKPKPEEMEIKIVSCGDNVKEFARITRNLFGHIPGFEVEAYMDLKCLVIRADKQTMEKALTVLTLLR